MNCLISESIKIKITQFFEFWRSVLNLMLFLKFTISELSEKHNIRKWGIQLSQRNVFFFLNYVFLWEGEGSVTNVVFSDCQKRKEKEMIDAYMKVRNSTCRNFSDYYPQYFSPFNCRNFLFYFLFDYLTA